ncbi:MAG: 2-oxoacid:acceptor oxidoreductase subunit alpha [Desulfovibrionaceae bacterium]
MPETSVNILVGGEAGQGLVTIGEFMAKALVRSGYEIHVTQDYMSRVRGGHNTFAIRTGPDPLWAPVEDVDILVALDQETIDLHKPQLSRQGVVIADETFDVGDLPALKVPFKELAPKPIFRNVAALGVLASTICHNIEDLEQLLTKTFGKKGDEVVEQNLEVLRAAYNWRKKQDFVVECMPPSLVDVGPEGSGRLMMQGNQAIALGALAAGCNFCPFYPMTPSTSIPLALSALGRDLGVVVEQVEDEISAMNMALGASFAGAKAMVATSGGGFALMCEGVSLAGMTETPIVIALIQRPGPATGLPTRTEQADLNLALYAGHGEFPRAILTPGTVEECFELAHKAFDLAERSQSPVFILSDQYLADSYRSVAPFDLNAYPQIEGPLLEADPYYVRHALVPNGVSPRVVPGTSKALVVLDSDEHTPDGHITEDLDVRIRMNNKRLKKAKVLARDMFQPVRYEDEDPERLLVCWGTTLGAAREAARLLTSLGERTGVLHFQQVWPLVPEQFMSALEGAREVVFVEGNATGQFAALIRQQTGFVAHKQVLRYDGLPFTARYIATAVEQSE